MAPSLERSLLHPSRSNPCFAFRTHHSTSAWPGASGTCQTGWRGSACRSSRYDPAQHGEQGKSRAGVQPRAEEFSSLSKTNFTGLEELTLILGAIKLSHPPEGSQRLRPQMASSLTRLREGAADSVLWQIHPPGPNSCICFPGHCGWV